VHLSRGDRAAARECAARALEIHPGLPAALVLMARADEGDEALRLAREARAAGPSSYDAAVTLAELLLARGDPTGALAELEAARSLQGCQNRVALLRARAFFERGKSGGPGGHADFEAARALCAEHPHPGEIAWAELRAELGSD
jgi:uncharacterized protein HemY